MGKTALIAFLFSVCLGFYSNAIGKTIKIVDFDKVEQTLELKNDTTYFINFWATWCVPCRIELPHIEEINKKYSGKKIKIILISLDFPNKVETALIPFVRENQLQSEVWLLNAKNPNLWIDKVEKTWSGAIPASVIFNKNEKLFFEKSFEFDELDSIIKKILIN